MRAGGDVRGKEGVPGDRVREGDLVEHPARGGEAGAGAGVRGEELVPGRGEADAGLKEGRVGPGRGKGEMVMVAAHAQRQASGEAAARRLRTG